jgi:membrane-bound lytic murein transglycosylase A
MMPLMSLLLGLLLSLLAGCSSPSPERATDASSKAPTIAVALAVPLLPGFHEDDLKGLDQAIHHQCTLASPPEPWPRLCIEFALHRSDLRHWLSTRFIAKPLMTENGNTQGLITGYYEPLLTGSRIRENAQQTALYRRPSDLLRLDPATSQASTRLRARAVGNTLLPYFSRADIQNADVLKGQELFYVDDAVEAFFLEIQGSGRVLLREPKGEVKTVRVGFADHNGHPYKAIGQVLIENKALTREQMSAEKIKQWLRDNLTNNGTAPSQATQVMQSNERFIFFAELTEGNPNLGPKGALAVPLTPERSIATDPKAVPLGSLVFVATTLPNQGGSINRFVVSQDIGAAITGQVRADFFFGFGDSAGKKASEMKQAGQLWILQPVL